MSDFKMPHSVLCMVLVVTGSQHLTSQAEC